MTTSKTLRDEKLEKLNNWFIYESNKLNELKKPDVWKAACDRLMAQYQERHLEIATEYKLRVCLEK